MHRMTKNLIDYRWLGYGCLMLCLWCTAGFAHEAVSPHAVLVGYGQSIPAIGETTERFGALDVVYRHRRVLHPDRGKGWYTGNHEFWIELPVSLVLKNRDDRDLYSVGMAGMNFLFAWVFAGGSYGQPYVTFGGGPRYVFADIEGVGSRTPGNYQAGVGYRFAGPANTVLTLDVRFVHVSNLNLASPNVPLNSAAGYIGICF